MEPFDVAQSFIELSARAVPVETLTAAFQDAVQRLGFRHFACCSHVSPLNPPASAVLVHNYPSGWVRAYGERRLHEIDPVRLHAEQSLLPFFWDAPEFRAKLSPLQEQILVEAAALGLASGYTIPIHKPWTPAGLMASCSVVPDSHSVEARNYSAVHLMAAYLYDAASRHKTEPAVSSESILSRRERQCLELVAQGKSDWAIGQVLSISEHTVHRHIERAKQRLGAATRVQAVIEALRGRQISLGDAWRADASAG